MKEMIRPYPKNQYEQGNWVPSRYIIAETGVFLRTGPEKKLRWFPAGSMFQISDVGQPGSDELAKKLALPVGKKLGVGQRVTNDTIPVVAEVHHYGLGPNLLDADEEPLLGSVVWETEPTLRHKLARSEVWATRWRGFTVGLGVGVALWLLNLLPITFNQPLPIVEETVVPEVVEVETGD